MLQFLEPYVIRKGQSVGSIFKVYSCSFNSISKSRERERKKKRSQQKIMNFKSFLPIFCHLAFSKVHLFLALNIKMSMNYAFQWDGNVSVWRIICHTIHPNSSFLPFNLIDWQQTTADFSHSDMTKEKKNHWLSSEAEINRQQNDEHKLSMHASHINKPFQPVKNFSKKKKNQ